MVLSVTAVGLGVAAMTGRAPFPARPDSHSPAGPATGDYAGRRVQPRHLAPVTSTTSVKPKPVPVPEAPKAIPAAGTAVPAQVQGSPPETSPPSSEAVTTVPAQTNGPISTDDPPASIPPSPNFLDSCSERGYDDSVGCLEASLAAIDNARSREGIGPMQLPGDWNGLTPEEQLFVVTNLERTARGLAPMSGMESLLDTSAEQSASDGTDPALTDPAATEWGSNWGDGIGNPLAMDYEWMYNDGLNSPNVACEFAGESGCWDHRQNILLDFSCGECLMGTGFDNSDQRGYSAWTEILVETSGSVEVDFTWSDVLPYLSQPYLGL